MHKTFWKYNIYWLLWLCLISYLSNAQSDGIPKLPILLFEGADKVVHAIFYFTLMICMRFGFAMQPNFPQLKNNSYSYPFVFSILWGILMELSQYFIFTYRTADFKDVLANITGAVVGLFFSFLATKLIKLPKLN